MNKEIKEVLITKEKIAQRVKELAMQIDLDYGDLKPLLICVLKGSYVFFADLTREMKIKHNIDFMAISSYGAATRSSGEVKMIKDLDNRVENKHIIVVEDIMDSGYTLSFLKKILLSRNPASVKLATLLDKPCRREVEITPDYCGFEIDDHFVVGYGLDYNEVFRNLPEIGILDPEVYENK